MAERTEKIRLQVEAPKGNLDSSSSGLNVALKKLGRINRMLKLVEARYKRIISLQGSTGGGGSPFLSSAGPLFSQSKRPVARVRATGGGAAKASLSIPASQVVASIAPGEFIRLKIPANQVVATVVGGVATKGGGGGGGKGGGGEKSGGARLVPKGRGNLELVQEFRKGSDTQREVRAGLDDTGQAVREVTKHLKDGTSVTQRYTSNLSDSVVAAKKARRAQISFTGRTTASGYLTDLGQRIGGRRVPGLFGEDVTVGGRARKAGLTDQEQAARENKARRIRRKREADRVAAAEKAAKAEAKDAAAKEKAAKAAQKATTANKQFDESNRMIGRNMLTNIKHVTSWAAAVTVLYKTLALGKFAMQSFVETEFQTARLTQVFRGTATEARRLADDVMRLAAVNGRSADEALQSAIQWSRLGMRRVEVNEAVRVSLMAANVAEISAADATERLSALYATYNLRVFELNSVLGQLNSTSNRFNVTNKDLLDGITKTAAAAKQAGINISELIGIIGGTVGTTGQTGKEIGNAIKSMIGIFSNPEKQGLLRDTFDFESMAAASGEMKGMSDILRDLFIHMQQLSEAEGQSLIFNVAGRRQASRLKAIMDSYVRSQVLAIQAQLDLSSGMEENEKIVATMRASFAGLVAEFERFVSIQGEGPATGLKFFLDTMRSILALMNGGIPGGQFITTAFLSVLTIAGARLMMISVAMQNVGQKAGFIRTSINALKLAYTNLNRSLIRATRLSGSWGVSMDNLARNIKKNGVRIKALGVSTATWARFNLLAAASIRTLTVALHSLWAALGPIVAIFAISKGIQVFEESTSGFAQAELNRMQKVNQEMEAMRNSAAAANRAIRLFDTAIDSIRSGNVGTRGDMFDQLAGASAFAEPGESQADADRRQERIEEVRKDYSKLLRMHREATSEAERQRIENELIVRQEQQKAEWIEKQARFRSKAFEAQATEVIHLRQAIKDIREGFGTGGFTEKAKKESIAELEQRIEQIRSSQVENILQERSNLERDRQAYFERDVSGRSFAKAQGRVVQSIADIYNDLSGGTIIDQHEIEIAKLTQIRDLYDDQLKTLKEKRRAMFEAGQIGRTEFEITKDIRKTSEAIAESKARLEKLPQGRSGAMGAKAGVGKAVEDAALAERGMTEKYIESLERKLERLLAEQESSTSPDSKSVDARISDVQKKLRRAEGDLQGAEAARAAVRQKQDFSIAARIANAQISQFGVDQETEGERLVKRRDRLESFATQKRLGAEQAGIDEVDKRNLLVAALQAENQLHEDRIRMELRMVELHGEEEAIIARKTREYQRALLTAGPAELLRKLAVSQLQDGRPENAGQFFAFGAGTRSAILELPQNAQELVNNRREQDALRGAGVPDDPNVRAIQNRAAQGGERTRSIIGDLNLDPDVQGNLIPESVQQTVNQFGTLVSKVNNSLIAFQARVDATLSGGGAPANANIPG